MSSPPSNSSTGGSILGEEAKPGRSLAATLKFATSKGYLEKGVKRQSTVVVSSAKIAKLEARSYTIEEKRADRREHHSRGHQLREVKEPEDYKPDINIEYADDHGRRLETPKEAFRFLCHKFHGKGPGKNKIDKRLKKQELESKTKSLAADGPLSSTTLMIEKQKELKTPYVILGKGK